MCASGLWGGMGRGRNAPLERSAWIRCIVADTSRGDTAVSCGADQQSCCALTMLPAGSSTRQDCLSPAADARPTCWISHHDGHTDDCLALRQCQFACMRQAECALSAEPHRLHFPCLLVSKSLMASPALITPHDIRDRRCMNKLIAYTDSQNRSSVPASRTPRRTAARSCAARGPVASRPGRSRSGPCCRRRTAPGPSRRPPDTPSRRLAAARRPSLTGRLRWVVPPPGVG